MKKNLLFILVISLLGWSFISCSDDDDDNNEGNAIELYINDVSQKTYPNSVISMVPISYDNSSKKIGFSVYFGDKERGDIITLTFEGISLNDLKVGDDIAIKTSWGNYHLFYENDTYMLFDNHPVLSHNQYNEYKGKGIVKEFDKNSNTIKVEFSNIKIPTYNIGNPYEQPKKTATVKVLFSGKIEFN
jgi:hypothetical protein